MNVTLSNGKFFQISDGQNVMSPLAEEIYSVIFGGKEAIRGIPVSRVDFLATTVQFSQYASDPLLVLDVEYDHRGPEIVCRMAARAGNFEADVAHDGLKLLDYALSGRRWIPLPAGAVTEMINFLLEAGVQSFGVISLLQYMNILRLPATGFTVVDRTANALSASTVSIGLEGSAPLAFTGKLYPYQLDGFRWLSYMARNGIGCVIADEMGLGKTVQVICLLLEAAEQGRGPSLVISPATLLENWRRELARFAPKLRVLVHSGKRRTGLPDELRQQDVVISSFETAVADISLFRNLKWGILCVDEAQGIKNPDARRTIQIKTIPRQCAIAVTGTPVENGLKDIWSITDFVVPSLLGPLRDFERRHPDTVPGAALLEPVVTPLILRRMVSEVAGDLPMRIEIPQPLILEPASVTAYESIREEAALLGVGAGLAALTRLRMFSTHPWLADQFRNLANPVECSVKLQRLIEIIDEMTGGGGKALIFTSYRESIDLLVSVIGNRFAIPTDFIDGRVPVSQRQLKVDQFTAEKSSAVLVLNPRAAGTGLNITAANHVIHFTPEWNPAIEAQATARAYRRGQKKPVTIHQLFYVNTVEEVIVERMQRKRNLAASAVIGTDGLDHEVDDLLKALRISPL